MYKMMYFPRIEEFDSKTNQIKVKDSDGVMWVAPLPYFGVVRDLPLDTPCLVITWDSFTRSRDNFDGRVNLNAIAFPIYNETRFNPSSVTEGPALVGSVDNKGNILTKVSSNTGGVEIKHGPESFNVSDRTYIDTPEINNADMSYGGFSKPQPYFLRFRPDFPYGLPEMLPYGRMAQHCKRISKIFQELK